jgi:hypothetical protein
MELPLVDVVSVLVWHVLSRGGIGLWDVLFHYIGQCVGRMGWVHWPSAHHSKSYVLVAHVCRMTPNSSLSFLYRMSLTTAWFVPDFHIHVYC